MKNYDIVKKGGKNTPWVAVRKGTMIDGVEVKAGEKLFFKKAPKKGEKIKVHYKNLQPLVLIDPQPMLKKKTLIRDLIPKQADWSEGEIYTYIEKPTGIGRLALLGLIGFLLVMVMAFQDDMFASMHRKELASAVVPMDQLTRK